MLTALGVATSSWYRPAVAEEQRRRPGPAPQAIPAAVRQTVIAMATQNPWYGYQRIAVMCRRAGQMVRDRQAYQVMRAAAERIHGPLSKPPFLVTDNGPSFIARRFAAFVAQQYRHVRIRYRTPEQLGLLERFHQTLKTEEVYGRLYEHPQHARTCLAEFRERYNRRRPHWALRPDGGGDPLVPGEVYAEGQAVQLPKWQGWARAAKAKLDELLRVPA